MVLNYFESTVDNEVNSIFCAADHCMEEVNNINYGEYDVVDDFDYEGD